MLFRSEDLPRLRPLPSPGLSAPGPAPGLSRRACPRTGGALGERAHWLCQEQGLIGHAWLRNSPRDAGPLRAAGAVLGTGLPAASRPHRLQLGRSTGRPGRAGRHSGPRPAPAGRLSWAPPSTGVPVVPRASGSQVSRRSAQPHCPHPHLPQPRSSMCPPLRWTPGPTCPGPTLDAGVPQSSESLFPPPQGTAPAEAGQRLC